MLAVQDKHPGTGSQSNRLVHSRQRVDSNRIQGQGRGLIVERAVHGDPWIRKDRTMGIGMDRGGGC